MKKIVAIVTVLVLALVGFGAVIANASVKTDDKPWICHPVEGKGETGYGWNLINPNKASSHIDEATGAGKHTRKDGRTDVYAVDGKCPGAPTEPTETPTDPTDNPTDPTDPTEPTDNPTTDEPVVEKVTPVWSVKVSCLTPRNEWITANSTEAYVAKVYLTSGHVYEIEFTANEGYEFTESDKYTLSDDKGRALVTGRFPVLRCVVPKPVEVDEPEIGTPEVEVRKPKNEDALPNTGA